MSNKPVWIKLRGFRNGARYDNRDWPSPGEFFQVPEWEAQALVQIKEAVYLTDEELATISEPKVSAHVKPLPEEPKHEAPKAPEHKAKEKPAEKPAPEKEAPKTEPKAAPKEEPKPERPAQNATKAEWVTYAVSQGHEESDAQLRTKSELQARYGGRL